ncbi:MAG: hypothetical protein QM778_34120 [Myxococcales bacterium]
MSRYRMRIVLLSLGVVFGYGSAIARHYRAEHSGQGWFCSHHTDLQGPHASRGGAAPKPVQ